MKNSAADYSGTNFVKELVNEITKPANKVTINTLAGSSYAFLIAGAINLTKQFNHLIILPDKESAAYFANDLEEIFDERDLDYTQKSVLFFPASSKKPYDSQSSTQNANVILRLETLNRLNNGEKLTVVTYSDAISEKTAAKSTLNGKSVIIQRGDMISVDNLIDILDEYNFQRVDFVTKSGEYAVRGGIIDIFSYSLQKPCRIEMSGDEAESLRLFDIVTQMSVSELDKLVIVPDLQSSQNNGTSSYESLLSYFGGDTVIWTKDLSITAGKTEEYYNTAVKIYNELQTTVDYLPPEKLFCTKEQFLNAIKKYNTVETGLTLWDAQSKKMDYSVQSQPLFNGNFDLLAENLQQLTSDGYTNHFLVKDDKQKARIEKIIEQYTAKQWLINVDYLPLSISQGFIDNETKQVYFTDHQLFNRYHKYTVQDNSEENEKLTLEDLVTLKPGDYVVHIDYGVGMFSGLQKIDAGGKWQEAIRLIYKNNDVLYVSIHSLHKISRYSSKDGAEIKLNRLGSSAWQTLKQKTKKKVKDIAKDLIKLYAQRKASKGFQFSSDSYLQNELEASFMYEDTVDQFKATKSVKADMEKPYPMDRLICGDVGFGKTEVAIRAAFKAVCDSKQVAVLVPTTILAFQHWQTFSERLKNMPCRVDYINRFRSAKEKTKILKDLKEGKIDILIGTHKIVGKEVEFKDLGLLIIDEEQKFGVSMKEKLRQLKVNIDTLTLTATPIPRTLQFSLMGARDLSIINTPPANRQPVATEVCTFNKEVIRDAVVKELSRGGQVYFVNNRVQNIYGIASLIESLVPDARICVGHGQMEGTQLENIMMDFINQEYDVLVATTIVENGLDIPNANTIIINDAQNYGLSDLHQLRGRVGRSNKKAYCYLLVPSKEIMTEQAQKRLSAIEEFSSVGSGFAIAMRDLDIRGAGNILGAEQSGFISEIGYETYNKILFEAMQELNEEQLAQTGVPVISSDNMYEGNAAIGMMNYCTIETDLEILIPDSYISNVTERLKIYKELDSMTQEEELTALSAELCDRFGKIPPQTLDLFDTVRIRRMATQLGIEKLILKHSKMLLNFNSSSVNFTDEGKFQNVLLFVNQYPQHCQLKEDGKILQLQITGIKTVKQAFGVLSRIINM
ncbi:MAG: transcription-repair coupling factor [Bacteroidales bacterium]|nr:transcription-repair coupling factor [Bacteroidales bacterium]